MTRPPLPTTSNFTDRFASMLHGVSGALLGTLLAEKLGVGDSASWAAAAISGLASAAAAQHVTRQHGEDSPGLAMLAWTLGLFSLGTAVTMCAVGLVKAGRPNLGMVVVALLLSSPFFLIPMGGSLALLQAAPMQPRGWLRRRGGWPSDDMVQLSTIAWFLVLTLPALWLANPLRHAPLLVGVLVVQILSVGVATTAVVRLIARRRWLRLVAKGRVDGWVLRPAHAVDIPKTLPRYDLRRPDLCEDWVLLRLHDDVRDRYRWQPFFEPVARGSSP